jgi:hypothetical protein
MVNFYRLIKYIFFYYSKFLLNKFLVNRNFSFNISNVYNDYYFKLKKNGYVFIDNFLNLEDCYKIRLSIDNFIKTNPNHIYHDDKFSDIRLFGSQNISEKINSFFRSELPLSVGQKYYSGQLKNLMTMANKVVYKSDNLGSGGGWHRDGIDFQYKAILYLVDVDNNNGPFQLIKNSQKLFFYIQDCINLNMDIFNTRFDNSLVEKLIKKDTGRLITLNGKAGSLILVDTTLIHRGCPLTSGSRYALTNYYYPINVCDNYKNQFIPTIKENIVDLKS